jgi:hypothetical protein
MMSPSEFMQKYRQMTVYLPGGSKTTVDAHAYVWNKPGKHSADKAVAMWGKIKRKLERRASHHRPSHTMHAAPRPIERSPAERMVGAMVMAGRALNSPMGSLAGALTGLMDSLAHAEPDPMMEIRQLGKLIRYVPYGKGAPDVIARYLRLAVRSGVTSGPMLQQFLNDRYVGIDCSGFVSNYIAAIGKMPKNQVGDYNAASYASGHPKRTSVDDLSNLDIMVWHDGGHVAIMEEPSKGADGVQATVVESNGVRGLGSEKYTFESVDRHGMFTVKRANGSQHRVRIFDWDLDV